MIVRADLPRGLQAAQLVHAAGESVAGEYLAPNTHAVVLTVPDEAALRQVAHRLKAAGIGYATVYENTAPYDGQLMALGVFPRPREEVRRLLSSLPLLK